MRNRFMRRAVVCILALAMMLSFDGVSTIASAAKAKAKAKAPKLSSKSIVVKAGSSKKVTIKNKPKKAKVTWKSKNKKIAKVSKSGKIKGVKAGKTTVTATVKYKKGKKTVKKVFLGSQVCMLMGELFFGAVMSIFILRWNALRGAIVIYPGIPMISYYLGSSLPVKWSNLLPGNWLMAARSNLVSKGGYSMAAALFVELLLFVICSCLLVNMRPGLERK